MRLPPEAATPVAASPVGFYVFSNDTKHNDDNSNNNSNDDIIVMIIVESY